APKQREIGLSAGGAIFNVRARRSVNGVTNFVADNLPRYDNVPERNVLIKGPGNADMDHIRRTPDPKSLARKYARPRLAHIQHRRDYDGRFARLISMESTVEVNSSDPFLMKRLNRPSFPQITEFFTQRGQNKIVDDWHASPPRQVLTL